MRNQMKRIAPSPTLNFLIKIFLIKIHLTLVKLTMKNGHRVARQDDHFHHASSPDFRDEMFKCLLALNSLARVALQVGITVDQTPPSGVDVVSF